MYLQGIRQVKRANEPFVEGCFQGRVIPWHFWFAAHKSTAESVATESPQAKSCRCQQLEDSLADMKMYVPRGDG